MIYKHEELNHLRDLIFTFSQILTTRDSPSEKSLPVYFYQNHKMRVFNDWRGSHDLLVVKPTTFYGIYVIECSKA